MKDKPRNLAASVRQRLTDLARKQGEDFQLILTRYTIKRHLYRLSQSAHRQEFLLKGGILFQLWTHQRHRPTRNLDLLGKGNPSIEELEQVFTKAGPGQCCLSAQRVYRGLTHRSQATLFLPEVDGQHTLTVVWCRTFPGSRWLCHSGHRT